MNIVKLFLISVFSLLVLEHNREVKVVYLEQFFSPVSRLQSVFRSSCFRVFACFS